MEYIEVTDVKHGPRDWPGDFDHENGNYMHTCYHCEQTFMGHKQRLVCKQCDDAIKLVLSMRKEHPEENLRVLTEKELDEIILWGT